MKRIILIGSIGIVSFSSIAQTPNSGFETWTNMGNYENPDQWGTLNNMTAVAGTYTCEKGTPGNPGGNYLMLRSKNVPGFGVVPGMAVAGTINTSTYSAQGGFPFTQRPQMMSGNWQYMSYTGIDFGFVAVYLTKWNTTMSTRDTISATVYSLTGMAMAWTSLNIYLNYQMGSYPDTAQIVLSASAIVNPADGDYLYADNLSFAGSVAGVENNESFLNSINIFPNPSNGQFIIASPYFIGTEPSYIEIYSALGEKIYETAFSQKTENTVALPSELGQGIYFLKIKTENGPDSYRDISKKIVLMH